MLHPGVEILLQTPVIIDIYTLCKFWGFVSTMTLLPTNTSPYPMPRTKMHLETPRKVSRAIPHPAEPSTARPA